MLFCFQEGIRIKKNILIFFISMTKIGFQSTNIWGSSRKPDLKPSDPGSRNSCLQELKSLWRPPVVVKLSGTEIAGRDNLAMSGGSNLDGEDDC